MGLRGVAATLSRGGRADRHNVRRVLGGTTLEDGGARDERIGACCATRLAVSGVIPPSTSIRMSRQPIIAFSSATFSTAVAMKA